MVKEPKSEKNYTILAKLVNDAHNTTKMRHWRENIDSKTSEQTYSNNWSSKIFSERNVNNLPVNENQKTWLKKIASQKSKSSTKPGLRK